MPFLKSKMAFNIHRTRHLKKTTSQLCRASSGLQAVTLASNPSALPKIATINNNNNNNNDSVYQTAIKDAHCFTRNTPQWLVEMQNKELLLMLTRDEMTSENPGFS